jgi:F-type H+-transporting ATPase subunit gamma
MTAASDNAEELMEELVRLRNRVRQQEITMEMLEVVGGADAIAAE